MGEDLSNFLDFYFLYYYLYYVCIMYVFQFSNFVLIYQFEDKIKFIGVFFFDIIVIVDIYKLIF